MKIAYKEKDCVNWIGNSCRGCIFEQLTDTDIWPCDVMHLKCYGPIIFIHSNNLSDVFQV